MSAFARATAVEPLGDGAFGATCDTAWNAPNGPNGGYLAAIVVRALEASLGDGAPYRPRSLTCHFLRPPGDGPMRVEVERVRAGRTVATLAARLLQDDRLCVLALAAFAVPAPAVLDYAPAPPQVARPEDVDPWPVDDAMPPIARRLELRHVHGPAPFTGADTTEQGGWMAIRDSPGPIDAPALALFADAWLPVAFARMTAPAAAPTLDLTLHFRADAPPAGEHVLGIFRSLACAEGAFEEDGELWGQDGTLLLQSRQLALLR